MIKKQLGKLSIEEFANTLTHGAGLILSVVGFFVLAVLANLCYCAAYIADVFAQFSGFRLAWIRWRWLLLTVGILFAGIITRFFALGFFSLGQAG